MAGAGTSSGAWANDLRGELSPGSFSERKHFALIVAPISAIGSREQFRESLHRALAPGTAVTLNGQTWQVARSIERADGIGCRIECQTDGKLVVILPTRDKAVLFGVLYAAMSPVVLEGFDLKPRSQRRVLAALLHHISPHVEWRVYRMRRWPLERAWAWFGLMTYVRIDQALFSSLRRVFRKQGRDASAR